MRRWGLTGGIASGKSTVAKMFAERGVPVVDADALYHEALVPGPNSVPSPLTLAVAQAFPGTLRPDGTLDRARLGGLVFADPAQRAVLEAITHPAVKRAAEARFRALAEAGHAHALYDVPLLFEGKLEGNFAGVVLVWVPEALQRARLIGRDRLTEAAATARLQSQWPLDSKRTRSDFVIDNSGPVSATQAQVDAVIASFARHPGA